MSTIAYDLTFLETPLLPRAAEHNKLKWMSLTYDDSAEGGESLINVIDDGFSYTLSMLLKEKKEFPFAMGEMVFLNESGQQQAVDLSMFDSLSFMAKCSSDNTLTFSLFTLDENASRQGDARSDRISTRYFHCNTQWQSFDIDITRLDTPEWWYKWYDQALSEQEYSLSRVKKISFGSSIQSPVNVQSTISIRAIVFNGKDWVYLYVFCALWLLSGALLLVWLLKAHNSYLMTKIKDTLNKERPIIAYQQLSIESHRDKDKAAILKCLATDYANSELNLEYIVHKLGINRNKINDILKTECGYTFSTYLNKLRLNEAARLLSENQDANVSEIAYSVGYKNVPYFNKLFKNEYGCSPTLFQHGNPSAVYHTKTAS
ncbi:helix-turn-helix domain-containing protein [Alteromonas sp. D210916BOD_24]|uniref:helix-turn-helix domain-containing protein n=1 Tax=Alteromonas sp. D210916BOD_24 TaxID=3157618 RepID=UPI00399D1E32